MDKNSTINLLDQSRVLPVIIITNNRIKHYYFDFIEENNPLLCETLNFFCGLPQNFEWNKGTFDFLSLKAIQMTDDILKGVEKLRKSYLLSTDDRHKKKISDLYNHLSLVDNGEWFLLFRITFHHPNLNTTECMKLFHHLQAFNFGMPLDEAEKVYQAKYSQLFENYDFFQFTDDGRNNIFIGEEKKQKRICRFCGKSSPEVSWNKAHAIPEGLGNKHIYCYEECKSCNTRLKVIDDNLTNWFDFRRNQAGVTCKGGGIPHGGGRNYVLGEDQSVQIFDEQCGTGHLSNFKLQGACPVTDQGIYKALCKIVVDLIDKDHLPHFQQTIRWINGEVKASFYPQVAQVYGLPQIPAPQETIFVSKDGIDKDDAPYCFAVLRIFDMAILYALPHIDNRMHFPEKYAQSFPYHALEIFGIDLTTIEWSDFSKTEERDPHVFIDLSNSTFTPETSRIPTPEKLRREKKPTDWIDFPEPQIGKIDVKYSEIKNLINHQSIVKDDLKYISGNVSDTKIVIDYNNKTTPFITMHVAYKDVRTNKYVLVYDASVIFHTSVTRNQILKERDVITIHYKMLMSIINHALDEICMKLLRQYPHIHLDRQNLSVHDAFELYDKTDVFIVDGNSIKKLKHQP